MIPAWKMPPARLVTVKPTWLICSDNYKFVGPRIRKHNYNVISAHTAKKITLTLKLIILKKKTNWIWRAKQEQTF